MFRNYIRIAVRNLFKNTLFTAINISGMAISIASFLVIALFIYDEFKFDQHVEDADLKFRVFNEHFNDDGSVRKAAMVPPMIGQALAAEYPAVESYFRILHLHSPVLFEVGATKMTESKGGYGDPTVFKMFSLKLVEGDVQTALKEINTIAINKTLARKYFAGQPAFGKTIEVSNENFVVDAVFEDFPAHSHLQLNYVLSMANLYREIPERMQRWSWNQFHTYVKLQEGADPALLESQLEGFAERNAWAITKPNGGYYIPHLMPIRNIHLHAADQSWDIAVRGNIQTVYILSATAIFILIIAILNFINLSTARAINRVKEVGVRKVVGAFRSQLIYQFISESVLITLISLLIAGLVTELVIPGLNALTEKNIPAGIFLNPLLLLIVLLFALLVGMAAGAYPAFYISGYKPAQILSNKSSGKSGKILLRKGLVVLQFILSFFLIIAALVVSRQHTFMRTADIGFDKNNVIAIQLRGDMEKNLEATKNAFLDHPNIVSASLGYGLPGEAFAGETIKDKKANRERSVSMLVADHDYIQTLGLELIAGRAFSKDRLSDANDAFILSETAARNFGYSNPAEAVGHELAWNRWDAQDSVKEGKVIGVISDLQLNSMRDNIVPVVLHIYPFGYSTLTMRVEPKNMPETIAHLEKTWKMFNTEWPFEYRFLDDNFDKMYKSEEKLATLFAYFTGFTISVACLGLFGLVVYSTTQKYKEISIRKVLGAEEVGLVMQLAKTYIVLIGIAFIIAIPLSYYAADQWLQTFVFHIEITPVLFIQAGLLIFAVAIFTVGAQSYKAARANPVNALKEQ